MAIGAIIYIHLNVPKIGLSSFIITQLKLFEKITKSLQKSNFDLFWMIRIQLKLKDQNSHHTGLREILCELKQILSKI